MKHLVLTENTYDYIVKRINTFNLETDNYHGVDLNDVLFSYFNSTIDQFHTLNDWDEGEFADPYWNKEFNEHSVIVFLKGMLLDLEYLMSEKND